MKKRKSVQGSRCDICDEWHINSNFLCTACNRAINKELKPEKEDKEILVDAHEMLQDEFYRKHGILRTTDM